MTIQNSGTRTELPALPKIMTSDDRKLAGKQIKMSLTDNKTAQLWASFMPERQLIANALNNDLIAMQIYGPDYSFAKFDPSAVFDQWAAMEVSNNDDLPPGFDSFTIPGGLYAVFIHKGTADRFPDMMKHILGTWLPASEYELDSRPHFQVMESKYKNNDPASEEEVWIPVRKKVNR